MGIETGDDAAVYRLRDDLALIQTVDFFPPIVDDPYRFGAIAVANAVSDVYAMGGTPLLAMNIVAYPRDLPKDILGRILKGGYDKATEAHLSIVGGHTIHDEEPKYGMAVTGLVRPGKQVTNADAQVGDTLVLTKAIGSGIITTAGKQNLVNPSVLEDAILTMESLNKGASDAMVETGVHACTDVTGFGLFGHLRSMAKASGVHAQISLENIPLLSGAWDLAARGIAPDGTQRNRVALEPYGYWDSKISDIAQVLLCDAQTSGGLLIAVAPEKGRSLLDALKDHGVAGAAIIGEMVDGPPGIVNVKP